MVGLEKAKSRLVAYGYKQREGIEFGEMFAPTVLSSCVRLWSAITCKLDLSMCHFNIKQAFVQSKLDEDVFLRLPKGCDSAERYLLKGSPWHLGVH